MDGGMSYVREIESLDKEIKRLNAVLKGLREQKKRRQSDLYEYMVANNKDKVGKITKKRIEPKEAKPPRKQACQKKAEAIVLFEQAGIPNPQDFWQRFQSTQK